jgi:DNA processing protein
MTERAAWVAMSAISGLGPVRFRRLVEQFGTALAALDASPDETEAAGISPELAARLVEIPAQLEQVEADVFSLEEQGLRPLIWPDADYPQRLLAASSPPPVLWWTGAVDPNASPAVAVIGSREVSEESIAWARACGAKLGAAGVAVISGLAAGIDAAAHEGALEAGGPTVGVCGCGLATALSKGQGGLAGRVAESGALCSELSPSAPILSQSLFARDRIIAGLSEAVIVAEARADGGAVHTAKCALQEGRRVLVVSWSEMPPGNRQLLAEGADRIDPEEDVLPPVS